MDRVKNAIQREFEEGFLSYIDAIDELIESGYKPLDAELIVSDWELEMDEE